VRRANRETSVIDHLIITQIAKSCSDDKFDASPCQIHKWYINVIERNIGRDLESVGLKETEMKRWRDRITVWIPPMEFTRNIIGFELTRLNDSLPQISGKRSREDMSTGTMNVSPMADEWMDQMIDILEEEESLKPRDPFLNIPFLPAPPPRCHQPRKLTCIPLYVAGLKLMRDAISGFRIVEVHQLMPQLNLVLGERAFRCVYDALVKFQTSLAMTKANLEYMLMEKPKRNQVHINCPIHIWYSIVLSPFAGRAVTDVGLVERIKPTGEVCLVPSRTAMEQLIEFELRRHELPSSNNTY
jgi:hypothetical protein